MHTLDYEFNQEIQQQLSSIIEKLSSDLLVHISGSDKKYDIRTAKIVYGDDMPSKQYGVIAQFIDKIILYAICMKSSDLHFESYETCYRIRMRLDGLLIEIANLPLNIKDNIISRIKILSRLDIVERRIPQDGRIRAVVYNSGGTVEDKFVDCRISIIPTLFGEKIAIRILDSHDICFDLENIGLNRQQKNIINTSINRSHGMVLVTGPTGSGKTTTLYSCINAINQPYKNITTIEDPVEITINGVNQVELNEKIGLSFESALRAFLRQDPDVIMVGEIRDLITAEIALKAAQTGHLVFSTLHTNDTVSAINRLINIGVKKYNITNSINCIIAQRLLRKLCNYCKQSCSENIGLKIAIGCIHCYYTGYMGRVGIFEVLEINNTINDMIIAGNSYNEIYQLALENGMISLKQEAIIKAEQGLVSMHDVLSEVD